MKLRQSAVALCILFLTSMGWSQGNMCHQIGANQSMCTLYAVNGDQTLQAPPTFTLSDNTATAKSINVFHTLSGSPLLAGFVSGFASDGTPIHYGWTSAHQVWQYTDYFTATNPNTWTEHTEMGTAVIQLAIANGTLYSLQSASGCTAPEYGIFQWTGTAWSRVGGSAMCSSTLGGAPDGTLTAVITYGWLRYSTNAGSTWSAIPYSGSGWTYFMPIDATRGIGVKSTTVYSVIYSGSTSTMNQTTNYPPAVVSSSYNVFVTGTDGNVYRYNNTTWDKLAGGAGHKWISTCGSWCTFVIDSGGQLYRYPDQQMSGTATLTGNTNCNPSPCPTGSTHQGTLTARFAKASLNGGQTVVSPLGSPETYISLSASDVTFDPFECLDSGFDTSGCLNISGPTPSVATIQCSIVGLIFSTGIITSGFPVAFHIAQSRVDAGSSVSCFHNSSFQCGSTPGCIYTGPFDFYCDSGINPTPPADYQFKSESITACYTDGQNPPHPDPSLWGFDTSGPCLYWTKGYPGSAPPLFCLSDPLPGAGFNGPITKIPLFTPGTPKNSLGRCTQYGVTH